MTPTQDNIWIGGDYSGPNRPMVRAVVQHVDMKIHDLRYNVYADFVFGIQNKPPKELPNIKSFKWTRGVDADVATATMDLYNTAPQPLGTVFQRGYAIDQPGYYTFNRGGTSYSSRWGQTENEWKGLLVGDNIIRTYEGYGFDATVCPDSDPNLSSSGVWIIKDVQYTAQGLITLTMEDLAAILRDQVCFHPVIPKNFYPLSFTSRPKKSGFKDGRQYTFSKTLSGGNAAYPPPQSWNGPLTAVSGVQVFNAATGYEVQWTRYAGPAPAGYTQVGYQILVDNQRLPTVYRDTTPTIRKLVRGDKGNVYSVAVVNIFKRTLDGHEQVGDNGTPVLVYPHTLLNSRQVDPGSIRTNALTVQNGTSQPTPGLLGFTWSGGSVDRFVAIGFHRGDAPGDRKVFTIQMGLAGTTASGQVAYQTDLGSISGYDWLVYAVTTSVGIGAGDLASVDGGFLNPPVNGVPPHLPNPPVPGTTVTNRSGLVKTLNPVELGISLSNTSNTYYNSGNVIDGSMFGHYPHEALDSSDSTYWLSVGNIDPGRGFAYEWFEVSVGNAEVGEVGFRTAKANYEVYLSVFSNGQWIQHGPHDVIGYNPTLPESHNGGDIPFCEKSMPGNSEGPHRITLRSPIPHVTKVRLTFHNLQDFGLGPYVYRAGLKDINVYGTASKGGAGGSAPPSVAGPAQDDNSPDITGTYTAYVPPEEVPGAGENPGYYEDYTDIIKLLLAWGGFFWPENAQRTSCNGAVTTYDWGQGPYGFKNVDPVLGDQTSGRVWGDFMDTGVAGITQLPIPQWDKKSLLDGISYVRDIIGYLFYIDEDGAAVWRLPNIFAVGNYVGDRAAGAARVQQAVTIDEKQTLIELRTKISSRNVRERYFIASTDGKTGALSVGYNPNPTGLRRVGGWTDQHFGSDAECQIMADFIALKALMAYRVDTIQIPGNPRIQADDQVRIFERVTGEGYLHYVRGISSSNDLETGVWTYDLDTNWLGEAPFTKWAFDPTKLSAELQAYLQATEALGATSFAPPPSLPDAAPSNPPGATSNPTPPATGQITKDVPKVSKLVQVTGNANVYITDGIYRRHVRDAADRAFLVKLGVVPSTTVTAVTAAELHYLQLVGPDGVGAP